MAHQIMDNEKCVTVGIPAWHGLGKNFNEPKSAVEAHDAMGGSFELYSKPVGVSLDDGEFIAIPGHFAIVRGPTVKDNRKIVFDYVKDRYKIIQPIDILRKFDEKVGVSISSLGLIQDGRKLFLSWKLPSTEIIEGDIVDIYGSVLIGFDSIFSSRLNVGTVRVVCANTFSASIAEADREKSKDRGRGMIYSGKHTNHNLLNELGEWMGFVEENAARQVGLVTNLFKNFAHTPIIHNKQAEDLIYQAWPDPDPVPDFYPNALKDKKQKAIDAEAERVERIRKGIYTLYDSDEGIAIDETYWGLFNASTQYFNHKMPSKKDTAFSITWGNRSNEMKHFADVLIDDIENRR